MAIFDFSGLKKEFKPLANGWYDVTVDSVEYKEEYKKMSIIYKTKDGYKIYDNFNFLKGNGEDNTIAYDLFAFAVKTILNDFDLETLEDEQLLIGHPVRVLVEQRPYKNFNGEEKIAINVIKREAVKQDVDPSELPF